MDRATILKSYGKDGQDLDKKDYDGTCRVIGLEVSPDSLDGADLANFDLVRRWLVSGEVKNYAQARDRFNSQPKEGGVLIEAIGPLADRLAEEVVPTLIPLAQQLTRGTKEVFARKYCAAAKGLAESQQFKTAWDQAVNGEAIDVDFFITGETTLQLPPSQP